MMGLGQDGARLLAEGLKRLRKLEELNLDNNSLGPEGARFIAEGLKGLGKLVRLYFGYNKLGPEGAGFIAEGLKGLRNLEVLTLPTNKIGPEGASSIAKGLRGLGKLTVLDLANNNLGPEGARFIAEGLKELKELQNLNLRMNSIGPDGARFIADGLKGLGKLERLYLGFNNIGPEGAEFIAEGLKGLGKLEVLQLHNNDLGPEGARFIAEGLKGLGKLVTLDLQNNDLGPEGARFIAEGLKGLGNLELLRLNNNNMGLGIWFLCEGLALGASRWEPTSLMGTHSLKIDLSGNMLDSSCLPVLFPIVLVRDNVSLLLRGNFFDLRSQSLLLERGFQLAPQRLPSSTQAAKVKEIGEWVRGYRGYLQQVRLYRARDSLGFREMENGVQFGVDDFGGVVEVLGGELSSWQLALEEYRRGPTHESLSLIYANIGALCLFTPVRSSWMMLALRPLSMTLI